MRTLLLLLFFGFGSHAQAAWLTVIGAPGDPAVDTVQVDPAPLEVDGHLRVMRLRVSRATQRTSWDGVPYRSYNARVTFDCRAESARYSSIEYFQQPSWQGSPVRTVDYTQGKPRLMLFQDVVPNPRQRIVGAACRGAISTR